MLFAPGLPDLAAVGAVRRCRSRSISWWELKENHFPWANSPRAGVRRISLATSLYGATMTGLLNAACEVKDEGQFGFLDRCVTTPELIKLMRI